MNKYDSLDFRLNILYDFVYNQNQSVCYKFKPIAINDITIDTIKKNNETLEKEIFSGEIKYIGYSHNKWHFKRLSDTSYPCTISIGTYSKNEDITQLNLPENVHLLNLYVLSELVANDGLKFITLPIANFDKTFHELNKMNSLIGNMIKEKTKINDDTKLYVSVTEHFFKMDTLQKFLIENAENFTLHHWKSLFFQVLLILHKITERLGKFRHNKLDLESIWIYKKKDDNNVIKQFKINDIDFEVPIFNFEIKLTDFESSISTDIPNKSINKLNDNPYYDIHYFFQNILFLLDDIKNIPSEVKQFIKEIIPDIIRYKDNNNFKGMDETYYEKEISTILNPSLILKKNNFFTEFIKENMDMSNSPVSNNARSIRKYNKKEDGIDYSISASEQSSQPRMLAKKKSGKGKKNSSNNSLRLLKRAEKKVANRKANDVYSNKQFHEMSSDDSDSDVDEQINRMKKKIVKKTKRSHKQKRTASVKSDSESSITEMSLDSVATTKQDELAGFVKFMKSVKGWNSKSKKPKGKKYSESENSLSEKPTLNATNNVSGQLHDSILQNIPENYFGALPENYQQQLLQQQSNPMMGNPMMGNPMMGNPMMGNPMMGNSMMGSQIPSAIPLAALSQEQPQLNLNSMNPTSRPLNSGLLNALGGKPQMSLQTGFQNGAIGSAGLGMAGMNSFGSAGMDSLGSAGLGNMPNMNSLGSAGMAGMNMGQLPNALPNALPMTGGSRIKKYKLVKNDDKFFF